MFVCCLHELHFLVFLEVVVSFSFCRFSYSLPKEIGNFVREKDPNVSAT